METSMQPSNINLSHLIPASDEERPVQENTGSAANAWGAHGFLNHRCPRPDNVWRS